MVGKSNLPFAAESRDDLLGASMTTPGLNALDQEREASMADEGGAMGALMESQAEADERETFPAHQGSVCATVSVACEPEARGIHFSRAMDRFTRKLDRSRGFLSPFLLGFAVGLAAARILLHRKQKPSRFASESWAA